LSTSAVLIDNQAHAGDILAVEEEHAEDLKNLLPDKPGGH